MFGDGATRLLLTTLTTQSNAALAAAKTAIDELKKHADGCNEKWRDVDVKLDKMTQQRAAMHQENKESIRWLFRVIWSTAITIILGLGYLVYAFLKKGGELP